MKTKSSLSKALLGAVLLILFAISSCKKEAQTSEALTLQSAKSWYLNQDKNQISIAKATNGVSNEVTKNIQWADALLTVQEGGKKIVTVPVEYTRANGRAIKGDYVLLISNIKGNITSKLVYSEVENRFKTLKNASSEIFKLAEIAFNEHNDNSTFNINTKKLKLKPTVFADNGGGGGPSTEDESSCTDWYLVTRYYDVEGNYLYSEETYLYTECSAPEPGGGGGGGTGYEQETFVWDIGNPVRQGLPYGAEEILEENGETYRVSNVSWKFHQGAEYYFRSTERMTVRTTGGIREIVNLVHQGYEPIGSFQNFTIELTSATFTPHINTWRAAMQLKYKMKIVAVLDNSQRTHYTDYIYNYAAWDKNFVLTD